MASNGFTAGVEPGGVYESRDIKLLVCYMLRSVPEPLPRQSVTEILAGSGMANFFETENALTELVGQQTLSETPDGLLTLTEAGRQAAADLSDRLPYTLRERAVQAALALLAREKRARENDYAVEKQPHGCAVTCRIHEGDADLLALRLQVADEWQARQIGEKFMEDPSALYRAVLGLLAGINDKEIDHNA